MTGQKSDRLLRGPQFPTTLRTPATEPRMAVTVLGNIRGCALLPEPLLKRGLSPLRGE